MCKNKFLLTALGALISFQAMAEVKPGFKVCNRMMQHISVVKGYQAANTTEVKTEGWRDILPGACLDLSWEGTSVGDSVYFYAEYRSKDGFSHTLSTGNTRLCINKNDAFAFDNASSRACNGAKEVFSKFRRYVIPTNGQVMVNMNTTSFIKRPSSVRACNKMGVSLWAARGYQASNVTEPEAKGWYEVKAGECLNLYSEDIAVGSNVYLYARYTGQDNFTYELSGDTRLCTHKSDAFAYDYAASRICQQAGNEYKMFRGYTLNNDGKLDIMLTTADFIKKPVTVQACNKMNVPVWAAKGYQSRIFKTFITEGWYEIKAGTCLGLLWDNIAIGDDLYFHSYYVGPDNVVNQLQGDTPLCIHGTNAFLYDNAASRACNQVGNVLKKFHLYKIPEDGKVNIELTAPNFGITN